MDINPDVLDELAARGLTAEHFDFLLRLLRIRRNGSWTLHYIDGVLVQNDIRLTFPNKPRDLQRVSDSVLGDNALLR